MAVLVHSLVNMWGEVNKRWPHRDHWSDGWLGDSRHSFLVSDHNPDSAGRVHATDTDATLAHAMGSGPVGDIVCAAYLRLARSGRPHPINYVIYRGVIYSRSTGFQARKYTGSNQHDSHVHCSVMHTDWARSWDGNWGIWPTKPTLDISKVMHAFNGHPASRPIHVARFQRRLRDKGYLKRPYIVGTAGKKTKDALKVWQKRHDYFPDGKPGPVQIKRIAGSVYQAVK